VASPTPASAVPATIHFAAQPFELAAQLIDPSFALRALLPLAQIAPQSLHLTREIVAVASW
jgi:hypothetical protein